MNTQPRVLTPESIILRLEWQVIRRLDGLLQGDYRSLFYGPGIDFADLREYQPGDDIRYIDWNVTARMDSPYVRQYIEDREITAWFLLDLSPSMDFGSKDNHKKEVLIDIVTTLSRLLTRRGNRVGAIFYNNHLERTIPARSGRIQVLHIAHELLRYSTTYRGSMTNLSRLFQGAMDVIKRRSVVIIISDFLSEDNWERHLRLLNLRHEVLAVQLLDPIELGFPDIGQVILEDSETGEQIYVDTHDKNFRALYHEQALARVAAARDACKHASLDMLTITTDEDMVGAFFRFVKNRQKRNKLQGKI